MTLKYPLELNEGQVDYVSFSHHEYRTNRNITGSTVSGAAPSEGPPIVLYMPATTPAVKQTGDWGAVNFDGPLGQIKANLAAGATGIMMDPENGISSYEQGKATGKKLVQDFKSQFESNIKNGGGAVRQLGVGAVAGVAGMQPNQLLAMQRGQIYNPNVELLYNGPKVRGFSFSFTFVPKSAQESAMIEKIILEFKKWSAPSTEGAGNGMFKVPHVWQVNYMTGGGRNPHLNAFKKAALTDVAVQNNSGMNMHMSFDDGMPIITSINLTFTEVDIITREDHLKSGTNVGY